MYVNIWNPLPIELEPEATLFNWRVMKVTAEFNDFEPTIHFVGYTGREGRVCSAIIQYDPKSKKAVTKSGRVYQLSGPSGNNMDALYVWEVWYNRCGTDALVEDITKEYE